jgi:hypothetical protein
MFRRFLSLSAGVLALLCVTGMPGQLYAQRGRGGFRPGAVRPFGRFMDPRFGGFRRDFDRRFMDPRFGEFRRDFDRRFMDPRFSGFRFDFDRRFMDPRFGGF